MANRISSLRALFEEEQIDGLLVSSAANRRYLSGFTGSAGYLLVSGDATILATDFRYFEQSATQAPAFHLFKAIGRLQEWLPRLLETFEGKRLGFEAADVSYALHRQMIATLDQLAPSKQPQLVPTTGLVERLRAIKDEEELSLLQEAIDLGDAAFVHAAGLIEPGWTERQVAWEIERYFREHGAEGVSFSTIVAGGPWGAMPHAYPRDSALLDGTGVVIDMGARLNGYCSDLTRTLPLGQPDSRFAKIYDIVLAAQLTACELIEPGMTGAQAHELAASVIEAAGFGEHFGHGLGHGIGLQVHESPWLTKSSTDLLAEGMVFSVEPGIYIPGWGGIRIEDLVVLQQGRCRRLSHAPKLNDQRSL
jgi:Xaa-Pro aminopeptidase